MPVVRTVVRLGSAWLAAPRLPIPVQRRRYELATRSPLPRGTTVEPLQVAGVPVERVTARGASGPPIVHLHGGAFCIGSPRTHRRFAAELSAAAGAPVVLPHYRRAPEHPCPAALDDAYAVWSALGDAAVLSGDSAGGGLALQVAVRARDAGGRRPARLVLLSPYVDAAEDFGADADLVARDVVLTPEWLVRCSLAYAAGRPLDDPLVSALQQDLSGLPPALVVLGGDELLAPQGERLAAKLPSAELLRGDGLWHSYLTQAGLLAEADDALRRVAAFLRADR